MKWYQSARAKFGIALGMSNLASVGFFGVGALQNHSWEFWYLSWNLFLAWVPLALMILLVRTLRTSRWSGWRGMLLTLLFLAFLPNTFYMATDIIHLQEPVRADLIYDVVMFTSFIINACVFGFLSLYLLHTELRKRLSTVNSWVMVGATVLLTSFAIYIGRDLRWNTWDVLLNPGSILFEVSERLLHPAAYPEVFTTTSSFFVLIISLYAVVWQAAGAVRPQKYVAPIPKGT